MIANLDFWVVRDAAGPLLLEEVEKAARLLLWERRHLLEDGGEHVERGHSGEGEVLGRPLLQLRVRILQVGVLAENVLDALLDLGKEVDELDVCREEEGASGRRAEVVLGVQQAELHSGRGPLVARNEVAKFTQDVTAHLHHVFVACRCLQRLENQETLIDFLFIVLSIFFLAPKASTQYFPPYESINLSINIVRNGQLI